MDQRRFIIAAGIGCLVLLLLLVVAVPVVFLNFFPIRRTVTQLDTPAVVAETPAGAFEATQQAIPTLTPAAPAGTPAERQGVPNINSELLSELYEQLNPGVVSLFVNVEHGGRTGEVAGSGFILDEQGHIVTNNHVVAGGELVIVIFYDGTQSRAEIIGTDVDSDLAVVRVDELPENTHPLPLGDSDLVEPGQWVVAIGNPFGLSSTMTTGIVSAVGRAIPSEAVGFSIPQSIQTDAAINPGNSGGPLLSLSGEVIGVNAQIATGGQVMANAGVGFAIPANIVRRVIPVLIEEGSYRWPWLGVVAPPGVDLFIKEANNLETQAGAYIHQVVEGGPADQAGLQGTEEIVEVDGIEVPVGGDVVIEANGERIDDFNDLLVQVAFASPGDQMDLTIIREGQQRTVTVELGARPENFQPDQFQVP